MILKNVIKDQYKKQELAEGWIQDIDGYIDMCFRVQDDTVQGTGFVNEFHGYLTYDIENDKWSGYFAYWTPEDGMPCDAQSSKFEGYASLAYTVMPNCFKGNFIAFKKLLSAIDIMIATCESVSCVELIKKSLFDKVACDQDNYYTHTFSLSEIPLFEESLFEPHNGALVHAKDLPKHVELKVKADGTLLSYCGDNAVDCSDNVCPQQNLLKTRDWLRMFGLSESAADLNSVA